ncbi:LysR substrate-binding domain-containing protein [Streptomyces sp. NPDC051217]|uniref:LysR substrate-binding domain-containing protein n=1 Tax=Streptomyces sp. NPDC051217 TaxID=3365644 RepID=UPI0037B10522
MRPALSDRAFAAAGVERVVALEVNDVHSLLDLVGHRLGLALVPAHIADKPQAAELSAVPLSGEDGPVWRSAVVVPGQGGTSPAAQRLLSLVPGLATGRG